MRNSKQKRSRKKKIIWITIAVIFLVIILLQICGGKKDQVITVQTEKVTRRNITQVVSATGKINPEYQVIITPEVTGEIVELPVKDGDNVKKGQLLIKIRPDIYIAQKDRAEANLKSAKATLNMRKNQLDFAQTESERIEKLYKNGISNKQEMERIKSELKSSQAQYNAQNAAVSQTEAALQEVMESLNKTTIYSPMDGTISQLNVELGERVLGSGFTQGTTVMTVADLSQMEADVEVDENDVVLVSIGDKANIELDAFKNRKFAGVVSQIANSAKTSQMGTQEEVVNFEIKITIKDFDEKFRPGMSCNADIETETKNDVLAVPIQSVTARSMEEEEDLKEEDREEDVTFGRNRKKGKQNEPKEVVFIVKDNMAKMKEVKMGISDDTYLEIEDGLVGEEEVISGPYQAISRELKDGVKILIKNKKKSTRKTADK